jgi:gluconolactonase
MRNLRMLTRRGIFLMASLQLLSHVVLAQESVELALARPDAIVDMRTRSGMEILSAQWRYKNAKVVERSFPSPGRDGKDSLPIYATGPKVLTNDLEPKAEKKEFNDSQWEKIDPETLEQRRGTGLLSFTWFRTKIRLPEKVGEFDITGATVIFEIVVDDYAEIFVDGQLIKNYGQSGGAVINGWNARNRVVLTTGARPGQEFQLAVLGMNGPFGDLPQNYIWIRSATLDFHRAFPVRNDWANVGEIVRINPKLDDIIGREATIEKLAEGFSFVEGPVWHPQGFLIFSDPNTNVIYSYSPVNGNVEVFRTKSGYSGMDIGKYHQPGSNGLAFDAEGRLTICQHGERRVIRVEKKGPVTVLADRFDGKRLNSPNDLVYRSDGVLFFTDPPYGLPDNFKDRNKQTDFSGVYAVIDNQVKLLTTDLKGPNGITFSPDEQHLYVSNWDITDIHNTKVIMRYDVAENGNLSNGVIFFDMNNTDSDDALDGLKVDILGNVYCAGPDGIWIISPNGSYLGKIKTPEHAANLAWGEDGSVLYITATSGIYRVRTKVKGTGIAK